MGESTALARPRCMSEILTKLRSHVVGHYHYRCSKTLEYSHLPHNLAPALLQTVQSCSAIMKVRLYIHTSKLEARFAGIIYGRKIVNPA